MSSFTRALWCYEGNTTTPTMYLGTKDAERNSQKNTIKRRSLQTERAYDYFDWGLKFDFITVGSGAGSKFLIAESGAASSYLTVNTVSSYSEPYFTSTPPAELTQYSGQTYPTYWKYEAISGTSQTIYGQTRSAYRIYPAEDSSLSLTVTQSSPTAETYARITPYTGDNSQLFYMVDIPDVIRKEFPQPYTTSNLGEVYKITCGSSVLKPRRYTSGDKAATFGASYNGNDDAWAIQDFGANAARLFAYNTIYGPRKYSTLVSGRNWGERNNWEPYFSAVDTLNTQYTWYDGNGAAHTSEFTPPLKMYYDDSNPAYWWLLMRRNVDTQNTYNWYPVIWSTGENGERTLKLATTPFSSSSLPSASYRFRAERVQPNDAGIPTPYGLSLVSAIGATDDTTTIMRLVNQESEVYLHFYCTDNPNGFQMRFRRTNADGSWGSWTTWEPVVFLRNENEYWAYNRPLYADSVMMNSGVSAKIDVELRATNAGKQKYAYGLANGTLYSGAAASGRFSYYRCYMTNLPLQNATANYDETGLHLTVDGLKKDYNTNAWDATSIYIRIKSLTDSTGKEYLLNEQTATFPGAGTWTIPLTEFDGTLPARLSGAYQPLTAEVILGIDDSLDAYSYTATFTPQPATGQASITYDHTWTAADGQVLLPTAFDGEVFTLFDGEKFVELTKTTIDGKTGFLLPRISGDYSFLTTRRTSTTWSAVYWNTFATISGTPTWTPAKSSALYWKDDDGNQHYLDLPTDTSAVRIQTQQQRVSTTWQLDGRRRDAVSFAPTISTTKSISAALPNESVNIEELEDLQAAGHALYSNPAGGLVYVAITGISVEQHARYTTIQISMTEE